MPLIPNRLRHECRIARRATIPQTAFAVSGRLFARRFSDVRQTLRANLELRDLARFVRLALSKPRHRRTDALRSSIAPNFASRSNQEIALSPFLLRRDLAHLTFRSFCRNSPVKTQTADAAIRENVKSDVRDRAAIFYFINKGVSRMRLELGVR